MMEPQTPTYDTRARRAAEYAGKWGGVLVEQADGDWLVIGAITKLGTPMTLRFGVGTIERVLIPDGPQSAPRAHDNDNSKLEYVCPAEWQGKAVPPREWWAEDLIPMRQVTILNGDGGVGKSLLALQFGAAGALQCETLGIRPLPGRVMYLGAEDEADEFHRRLADIVYAHQRELSDLTDFMLLPLADADALLSIPNPRSGVMEPTPLWLAFADDARDFRPKMIVLDTVADLFGGDEIRRAQVRQFISMLRKLAIEIDCAIVLLAHPSVAGMASGTGSSGSTAWNNSVRSRLYLTRPEGKDEDPDMRVMKTMKANYGKTGGEIRLRWCEGAFILDDGRATPTMGLLNRKHDEAFMDMLARYIQRGINVSANAGPTYAPSKFAKDSDGKGTSKQQYVDAMGRLLDAGRIKMETFGRPGKERSRLVIC